MAALAALPSLSVLLVATRAASSGFPHGVAAAAGLLLTLSDQKAVLFNLAFFPAFVEIGALSWSGISLIVATTVTAVGGAKIA